MFKDFVSFSKKICTAVAVVLFAVAVSVLSGCSFFNWLSDDWLTKDQKEITDEAMKRLCTAVENNDSQAVKAVFSYDDISGIDGFDGQAEKLCRYITGGNITFNRKASGSDGAAMGGYPREREFGGVRYNINTSTDEYKVCFGYRSYYSEGRNSVNKNKIGFTYLDIINVKNDRATAGDRLYGGCPFNYKGINFDYRTTYIFCPEEYDYKVAYCDKSADFDPVIINSISALEQFYSENKESYTLETRSDGKGFKDVVSVYNEEFFSSHSLYIAGMYHKGGGYEYVPQFLYIGDFVLTDIAVFPYDSHFGDFEGQYTSDGVIFVFELPEKVPDGINAILKKYYVER